MDFTTDTRTFDIDNAYMFGTSLLVRPVFHPQSEEKNICIYLPEHSGKYWYDFWTGEAFEGGREQMQTNILDILPLYVKAGSILPLAEVKQYAMEYPDRELELRIYGGADAAFLWYEDEGDSYRYEEGVCSKVPMQWKDSERTLTIGLREDARKLPNLRLPAWSRQPAGAWPMYAATKSGSFRCKRETHPAISLQPSCPQNKAQCHARQQSSRQSWLPSLQKPQAKCAASTYFLQYPIVSYARRPAAGRFLLTAN